MEILPGVSRLLELGAQIVKPIGIGAIDDGIGGLVADVTVNGVVARGVGGRRQS